MYCMLVMMSGSIVRLLWWVDVLYSCYDEWTYCSLFMCGRNQRNNDPWRWISWMLVNMIREYWCSPWYAVFDIIIDSIEVGKQKLRITRSYSKEIHPGAPPFSRAEGREAFLLNIEIHPGAPPFSRAEGREAFLLSIEIHPGAAPFSRAEGREAFLLSVAATVAFLSRQTSSKSLEESFHDSSCNHVSHFLILSFLLTHPDQLAVSVLSVLLDSYRVLVGMCR